MVIIGLGNLTRCHTMRMERGNIVWFWSGGISRWGIWTPYLDFLARGMCILTTKTLYKNSGGCKLGMDVKVSYISQSTCIESSTCIYSTIYAQIMCSLPSVYSISRSTNVADCRDAPSHSPLSLCRRVLTDSFPTLPCRKYSSWFCLPTTAIFLFNDKRPAKIPNIFRRFIRSHGWTWGGLALFLPSYERRYLFFNTSTSVWIKKYIFQRDCESEWA